MTATVSKPYLLNSEILRGIDMANQKLKPTTINGKTYIELPDVLVKQLNLDPDNFQHYFKYEVLEDTLLLKCKVDIPSLLGITEEQYNAQTDSVELDIK